LREKGVAMETATREKFWKELMVPTFLTLNPFKYVSTEEVICLQGRIKMGIG